MQCADGECQCSFLYILMIIPKTHLCLGCAKYMADQLDLDFCLVSKQMTVTWISNIKTRESVWLEDR
jgi:hypothetical protein